MSIRYFVVFTTVSLFYSAIVYGQGVNPSSITGRIVDPQGAVVASARVLAKNQETGVTRETRTTADGAYTIPYLPTGIYDLRVEAPGFAAAEEGSIRLQTGERRDLNFTLKIGAQTETVEVTGGAPLVESTKTDTSTIINSKEIEQVPAQATAAGISAMNDYAGLALAAPGVRFDITGDNSDLTGPGQYNNRSNVYNVDGGSINDTNTVARDMLGASLDEVKEFQVITNNYDAEYGEAGGLILNITTKSGTNSLHGDFHFYGRGTNMEAVPFWTELGHPGISAPPFMKHETGFTLGGPFVKDKTHWFVSYEKVLQGLPEVFAYPPGSTYTITQPDDEVQWTAKLDQQINSNNHLTGRVNFWRSTLGATNVQLPTTNATSDALINTVTHDHLMNISETAVLTPRLVNEARVFWHHHLLGSPTATSKVAIRTANSYTGAAFCCPQFSIQDKYTGTDDLTWTHGAHTMKFGIHFDYNPTVSVFQQYHFGQWLHGGRYPATAPGGANPPKTFTIGIGPGATLGKDNLYAWYAQDSWKLRPNLTVNYGVRWDYEAGGFRGGKIPINGSFANGCLQGNGLIPACSSDKNNFQPRLGISYGPSFDSGPLHELFGDPGKSLIKASFAEITQLAYFNVVLDSLNFDGSPSLVTLQISPTDVAPDGTPASAVFSAWPNTPSMSVLSHFIPPPSGGLPCTPATPCGRIRPIANNLHNPETRNVSLTWDRQIGNTMVASLGYVGSFGFGQFGEVDTNYPLVTPDPAHPGFFYIATNPACKAGGPAEARPNCNFGLIRTNTNSRNSAYHGLLASFEKRTSHHSQFRGTYTWSHLISSTEGFYGVSEVGNPFDSSTWRGPSQADIRHMGSISLVLDTNNMFHISGVRHFLNNWQFATIGTYQAGRPYPISTGDAIYAGEAFAAFGAETQQVPNVLSDGTISLTNIANGLSNANLLISQNGAAVCACPQTTFLAPAGASKKGSVDTITGDPVDFKFITGNVGKNQGLQNGIWNNDISVTRSFRFPVRAEGVTLQLRAEIFNVFNHPNLIGFNFNDVLSGLAPCANTTGTVFYAGCKAPTGQMTGIDVFSGKIYGLDGSVLTKQMLQHGQLDATTAAKFNLLNPRFGGFGNPSPTPYDVQRQLQLSIRVLF